MLYNYVRFGPIADVAAALRPGISEEPWFQRGLFHPSYSLRHLRVLFLALPVVVPRPPYLLVPWGGVGVAVNAWGVLWTRWGWVEPRSARGRRPWPPLLGRPHEAGRPPRRPTRPT